MMKHKGTFWKFIGIETAGIVLFLLFFCGLLQYQYQSYTQNFNKKIGEILGVVMEQYPQVSSRDMIDILNGKTEGNEELLRKYGMDSKKDSLILENDKKFRTFVLIDGGLILLFFGICIGLIFRNQYGRERKIEEITAYLEEINRGNYKLDIADNSEENWSILKNELYKTTVMLKEAAENSEQDKIQLKDSLSDISHQIKTPLTSMIILLDAILDDKDMEEQTRNQFLHDMKREITGIKFLVEALLKLSKLDSNTVKFTRRPVKIEDILTEAVKNVEILGELKNISIRLSGDTKQKVECDVKWQTEAITNILKNCIEHSEENGEIRITHTENFLYTEVAIEDFGRGIAVEDLPHIFERFYKGKASGKDSVGIGLALAKAIIEKDNGYILADSKPGEGTKFRVRYFR